MYDEVPVDIGAYEPNAYMEFVLVVAVIAALALGAAICWAVLRQRREQKLERVYTYIRNRGYAATIAKGGEVISKAQELLQEIETQLGAGRRLHGGLNPLIKKVSDALTSHRPASPEPKPAQATLTLGSPANIGLNFPATITPTPGAPPPSTLQEHIEAVSDAVQAFYDHWNKKQARMEELRAAQRELL